MCNKTFIFNDYYKYIFLNNPTVHTVYVCFYHVYFILFLYFLWIHNLLTQVSSRSAELGHNSERLDTKRGVASRGTSQTAVQSDDPGKAELSRRKWLCWLAVWQQLPRTPATSSLPFLPTDHSFQHLPVRLSGVKHLSEPKEQVF